MSVQASLDLFFKDSVSPLDLIGYLLAASWTYDDHGNIVVLPLGDDNMFNWQAYDLSAWSVVQELIKKKNERSELIGIALTWKDSKIGGEFLFYPDLPQVSVCLSINRKIIESSEKTDFAWYVSRIVEILESKGCGLEYYKAVES